MTLRRRLSPVRAYGATRIAALEEWSVTAWTTGARTGGGGTMIPRALLIAGPGGVAAYAPSGAALTEAEVETLLPGALAEFATGPIRVRLNPEEDEEEDP